MDLNNLFIDSKLPKPLTKEQLSFYLEKCKQGDLKAREDIIVHNIRLVLNRVCKDFANTPYDKGELISVGLIGLVKSVDTFDIEKNFEFSTYATRCIDNAIFKFMSKNKKYINDESLYTPIGIDDSEIPKVLEDVLEDPNSDFVSCYEDEVTNKEIREILETLPYMQKRIIMLHFGFVDDKVHSKKEISERYNISYYYVSQLIAQGVTTIGSELKNKDVIETTNKLPKKINVKFRMDTINESFEQSEYQSGALKKVKKR